MNDIDIDDFLNSSKSKIESPETTNKVKQVSYTKKKVKVVSRASNEAKNVNTDIKQTPKAKIEKNSDGSIANIYISQSFIKKMFFKGEIRQFCPYYLKKSLIDCTIKKEPTISMLRGSYFESMLLGETSDGTSITDLPRKYNGDKTVDHERIDEQVEIAKIVSANYHIDIENGIKHDRKVAHIDYKLPYNVFVTCESDLLTPLKYHEEYFEKVVLDVKLTKDRDSIFGEFCWGNVREMDHIQADVYSMIYKIPFFYYLWDYRTNDRGHRLIPVETIELLPSTEAKNRRAETKEAIRRTAVEIAKYENYGWNRFPVYQLCKKCPFSVFNYALTGEQLCLESKKEEKV